MEDQNKELSTQPTQHSTPPSQNIASGGQRVLQPTEAILKEIGDQPIPSPITPAQVEPAQAVPSPTNPTPPSNAFPTAPNTQNAPPADDFDVSTLKVCNRTTSLRMYAIVMLILSALGLISALGIIAAYSQTTSKSTLSTLLAFIKDITYVLPLIAAILFLTSRSVVLVKSLLAILLINYAVGVANVLLVIFAVHSSASLSVILLGGLLIPVIFLYWTWSIFSEVQSL